MNPAERRLAILVEDHPLDYIDFEGIIPEGYYGAGVVVIWDRGSFEPVEMKEGKTTFVLNGEKLKGGFTLTHLKGRGKGNEWLLIKKRDQYAQPTWKLERSITPDKKRELQERIPPCEVE